MDEANAQTFLVKIDARGTLHEVPVNARDIGEAVDQALTMVLSDARMHGVEMLPEEVDVVAVDEQTIH